jgi:hypothetical protein
MKSCGFFGITNYGDFGFGGVCDTMNNVFKLPSHFIAKGRLPALAANVGRNISDNDNTTAHIGSKGRVFFPHRSFAHKTGHACLTLGSLA